MTKFTLSRARNHGTAFRGKGLYSAIAAIGMVGLAVTGCSSEQQQEVSSDLAPAGLVNAGEFTVCSDVSFPPMEFFAEGSSEPQGFDIDVIEAVAEKWEVKANINNTSFDGLFPALDSKRCDVIWSGIYVTEERTASFPAIEYFRTGNVLFVAAENADVFNSIESLAGQTIAVQTGTSLVDVANEISEELVGQGLDPLVVQQYPNDSDIVQQILVGRAAGGLTADTQAAYNELQHPGKLAVGFALDSELTMGVFYRSENVEIADALRAALNELSQDGTLKALANEWNLNPSNLFTEF